MSTTIEWTQNPDGSPGKTWNPTRGCSRCSPGCQNCYAMRQAHRFNTQHPQSPYHGLTTIRRGKVDWMGSARFIPEQLGAPLRWKKPQRVFVNSMSDLFHESLTTEEIAAVFGVMAACPQHTFQVLTKRPKRAQEFFRAVGDDKTGDLACAAARVLYPDNSAAHASFEHHCEGESWPLPNVWLGVSVEDQATADWRIPALLGCPAAVRFVSYEPALEKIDFSLWMSSVPSFTASVERAIGEISHVEADEAIARFVLGRGAIDKDARLDWIITGGESGHGARPFDMIWAERLVDLGRITKTPIFVKQMGAAPMRLGVALKLNDKKGGDMAEWPPCLRVRQFPEARR